MASYPTGGVPPRPASKRRRRNVPKSYGSASPTTAPGAAFDRRGQQHLVQPVLDRLPGRARWPGRWPSCGLRTRVLISVWPSRFRGRTRPRRRTAPSPTSARSAGARRSRACGRPHARRPGIELKSQAVDVDEDAAVSMVGKYRQALKSV